MGFDEVWARIKEKTELKTFVELASVVGVQQSAVSKARNKDDFPPKWIFTIAQKCNLSSDWIKFGVSPEKPGEDEETEKKPAPGEGREPTIDYGQRVTDLDLTKGVALLAKIYGSGDQVLIRAIVANLSAFSESIDNKARAIEAEGRMSQMEDRLKALEKQLAELVGARGNERAAGNGQ